MFENGSNFHIIKHQDYNLISSLLLEKILYFHIIEGLESTYLSLKIRINVIKSEIFELESNKKQVNLLSQHIT